MALGSVRFQLTPLLDFGPLESMMYIGIDLAWGEATDKRPANESGVVMLDGAGRIVEAGWAVGIEATATWLVRNAPADALLLVDAPLVVNNDEKQRPCEQQVGHHYGRWNVSALSTNRNSERLAGVLLRVKLEQSGWTYSDGAEGPPTGGRVLSECYPYTTIVGVKELGYDKERPRYKRKPKTMRMCEFRPLRASECDELIGRIAALRSAVPPLDLPSHPETQALVQAPSPTDDRAYKHREDLLDAAICAWTASFWARWGLARCQVLGLDDVLLDGRRATIIAPARDEQRVA